MGPVPLPEPFVMLTRLQSLFLFSMLAITNDSTPFRDCLYCCDLTNLYIVPKNVLDAVMAALEVTVLLTEYDDLKPLLKLSGFCGALMDDISIQQLVC